MLFTLTSLSNFLSAQLKAAVCLCCLPTQGSLKHGNGRLGWGVGCIMAVRPGGGGGKCKPELLQEAAAQHCALNTVTPPCVMGYAHVHATMCAALPRRVPTTPTPLPP